REHLPDLVMACDQPGSAAVPDLHPLRRTGLAEFGGLLGRRERATAVEREVGGWDVLLSCRHVDTPVSRWEEGFMQRARNPSPFGRRPVSAARAAGGPCRVPALR